MNPLSSSLVRILRANGTFVGNGCLISEKQVITLDYVIDSALRKSSINTQETTPTEEVLLDSAFFKLEKPLMARITHWPSGEKGQFAVLELNTEFPDNVHPAQMMISNNLSGHMFKAFGFPKGYKDGLGVSGKLQETLSSGKVQMDISGGFLDAGFGGTPIWDVQLAGVVGLLEERSREANIGFMRPFSQLVEMWPELSRHVIQKQSPTSAEGETHFIGPISGQVDTGSGDITIRIAREALVDKETSGSERLGVNAEGDVIIVEPKTPKVLAKLPQEAAYCFCSYKRDPLCA